MIPAKIHLACRFLPFYEIAPIWHSQYSAPNTTLHFTPEKFPSFWQKRDQIQDLSAKSIRIPQQMVQERQNKWKKKAKIQLTRS